MNGGALPGAVQAGLISGSTRLAWLELNDERVARAGGDLTAYGLDGLVVEGQPLPEKIEWVSALDGELPVGLSAIASDRGEVERYDFEAWSDAGSTWVVLRDASVAVRAGGVGMQVENDQDLLRERLAGAERLRRGERRARGMVLRALGYAMLERGPDGGYRPGIEPADWLVELCGWDRGEPRVLWPTDPTDFLTSFLEDADAFFAEERTGATEERSSAAEGPVVAAGLEQASSVVEDSSYLASGVWSETQTGPDGETRERTYEAWAIALPSGRGVVAVERLDVSGEIRRAALQRQRDAQLSFEGLAREIQVKDVLLHCIVHDLRGPLSSLVGSLSLMQRGGLGEEEQLELVDVGLRQARRQEEMISNVLSVFAAEYEALVRFDASPENAPDVIAVTHETVRRQEPAYAYAGVDLRFEGPPGPILAAGRADRLERIVANLAGNALRHAPKGTEVTVRVTEKRERVRISVLDRGPGVPPELRDTLFQRFVQGKERGSVGLGLFYVRMTVERWGGSAHYEDREGGGAAFHVDLVRAIDRPGAPSDSAPGPA